jgi:phosphate/sulfate permease
MAFAITLIVVFILLAIVDLVVGVSNDAVNFLNSAVGSRVAPKRIINWVAATGLIIGVFFSAGMMDLARTGVIVPQNFTLLDMMAVFVAVMITDIILIDACNTYGFPTSTTTALILELIGGGLAIAILKSEPGSVGHLSQFIDTNQVFMILAGIFISIFIAFFIGVAIQFLARIIFTFNFQKRFGFLFSLAGALSVTVILFFILKKALHSEVFEWDFIDRVVQPNLNETLAVVFLGSFSLFMVGGYLFKTNIPKLVVLFGTFALALSFAANDLVNFIGVPLAGIESTHLFMQSGQAPDVFYLNFIDIHFIRRLTFSDNAYLWLFGISGVVLCLTLFFSRKTRYVIQTEVLLERQASGYERFEPSYLSRSVVRNFLFFHNRLIARIPNVIKHFINSRYARTATVEKTQPPSSEEIYFDSVRASVNLVVASIMILIGTFLKIPLSTTFIVFMVSMGTSLADQAWGRDSAVYRISGVLTVLGTWFLTSCMAFLGAFLLTFAIWYGKIWVVIALLILTGLVLTNSYKKYAENQKLKLRDIQPEHKATETGMTWLQENGGTQLKKHLLEASKIYLLIVQGFLDEDLTRLREASLKSEELLKQTRKTKENLFIGLSHIPDQMLESGHHFIQAIDYLSEMSNSLHYMAKPIFNHVNNNHKGLNNDQAQELTHLLDETMAYFNYLVHLEKEKKLNQLDELISMQHNLISYIEELGKNQIKRIKAGESKTKVSMIYLDLISENKNLILYSINTIKSHRDFINSMR